MTDEQSKVDEQKKNDGLKAFKIADQVKRSVDPPRRGGASVEAPAGGSAGFPLIERLVEADKPDLSGLATRQAQLEELANAPGLPKDKAAAKKGAAAYAKVRALIDHLLDTKAKMAGQSERRATDR